MYALIQPSDQVVLWNTERADVIFHLRRLPDCLDTESIVLPTNVAAAVRLKPQIGVFAITSNNIRLLPNQHVSETILDIRRRANALETISAQCQKAIDDFAVAPGMESVMQIINSSEMLEQSAMSAQDPHFIKNIKFMCSNYKIKQAWSLGIYYRYINRVVDTGQNLSNIMADFQNEFTESARI